MDFKNLASKIIDDVSGIKTSDTSKIIEENDILEGLDLDFSENESKDLSEDFDLDIEEIEPEEKVEQLFDGYLGEKNFAPNPLEYGPNAMYRQNGTVYKKSVDNLWEVYLQDGKQGPKGSAGGSGTGVQEVRKEITSNPIISNFSLESSYISSESPVLTKYSLPVRYLDRPIRIATFGDSRANWSFSPMSATDTENYFIPFTSGSAISITYDASKAGIKQKPNCLLVANDGFSGQTTSQMVGRSTSSFFVNRKAIQDIIKKKPDVVLFRGNINDLTGGITSSSTYNDVVFYFNRYKQLVNLVTDAGIPVIDTGALGWRQLSAGTYTDNDIAIQNAIKITEQLIDVETDNNPLWRRLDCENTIVQNAKFLDNISYDGLHMTSFGGYKLSNLEKVEIDKLFKVSIDQQNVLFDTIKDFANPLSASYWRPANRSLYLQNVLITSSDINISKWTAAINVSSTTNSFQVTIGNMRTAILSALTSGDNFLVRIKIDVTDSNGVPLEKVNYSKRFRPYTIDNVGSVTYEDGIAYINNGRVEYLSTNAMPLNSTSFGTSTEFYYSLKFYDIGDYIITIYPEYVYKYTPLNTL